LEGRTEVAVMRGLGLRALVAAAKPGECPFCGEPRAKGRTKPHLTCGAPECRSAYHRYWKRDLRSVLVSAKRVIKSLESVLGAA
jgi:hypothetical protein